MIMMKTEVIAQKLCHLVCRVLICTRAEKSELVNVLPYDNNRKQLLQSVHLP